MIITIEQDINLDVVIDFMNKYSASELLESDWEDLERLERCIKKPFEERII